MALRPDARSHSFSPSALLKQQEQRPRTGTATTSLIFGLCVLTACGRGVLEVTVGKELGYGIQAVALVLLTASLYLSGFHPTTDSARNSAFLYGFALAVVLSSSYVSVVKEFAAAWIYAAVMLLFAIPMWFFSSNYIDAARRIPVSLWLGAAGTASVIAATAQQTGLPLDTLPGSDIASLGGLVRPSGLSGSFLHYPLFIALTFFVFAQLWSIHRRAIHGLLATVFAVAVVASLSRSGAMILILGVAALLITARSGKQLMRLIFATASILLALFLGMGNSIYFSRIVSSVDLEAGGNSARVTSWLSALELWAESPIIIGGYTGMYTNITQNFGEASSGVVESGLLQQLVSVGLVGAILYYALMVGAILAVNNRHSWLRAGMVGALLETFVYQSVEVVPFMVLFLLMPVISMHIAGNDPGFWTRPVAALSGRSARVMTHPAQAPPGTTASQASS